MRLMNKSCLETKIEDKFFVLKSENDSERSYSLNKELDTTFIQFHFVLEGETSFLFNNGTYKMNVLKVKYIVL